MQGTAESIKIPEDEGIGKRLLCGVLSVFFCLAIVVAIHAAEATREVFLFLFELVRGRSRERTKVIEDLSRRYDATASVPAASPASPTTHARSSAP